MNAHIIVSGHVQGVGFRYTAQQTAMEYGLTGWVQNQSDGTVELEIEGKKDKIERYIEQLRTGLHRYIRVDDLVIKMSENKKGYKGFTIR